jgi:hypothetical protein
MAVSKFREVLPILHGDDSLRLGVCAMGPVAKGDQLTAMRVWVWQLDGEKVALSSGKSGDHLGAHPLAPSEKTPFTTEKGWMIQTELEEGSPQFSEGKPALAMAIALVTRGDGSKDVERWDQAVMVAERRHHEHPEDAEHPQH